MSSENTENMFHCSENTENDNMHLLYISKYIIKKGILQKHYTTMKVYS